jgi:hypothetical protein
MLTRFYMGLDASEQFSSTDGLYEKGICAKFGSCKTGVWVIIRSQEDDRDRLSSCHLPDCGTYGQSIHIWHHKVKHNRVDRDASTHNVEALLPIIGRQRHQTLPSEELGQQFYDNRIIIDD